MEPTEKELFDKLILASGKLATAADQANNVLSEEHQTLTAPFIEEVRIILAQCDPVDEYWDGELRESDLRVDSYRTNTNPPGPDVGAKILHLPTGIGRQSESKPTYGENRAVAMKSLTEAVDAEYKRRG